MGFLCCCAYTGYFTHTSLEALGGNILFQASNQFLIPSTALHKKGIYLKNLWLNSKDNESWFKTRSNEDFKYL